MKQIVLTPEKPWKAALKAAKAEVERAGGVVLVATTPRARRHLEKINREYQFPRRHHPESAPETWPRRSDEVAPRTFIGEEGDWHLVLSLPDHEPGLDKDGLPVTD
jgi:hypothetical protein